MTFQTAVRPAAGTTPAQRALFLLFALLVPALILALLQTSALAAPAGSGKMFRCAYFTIDLPPRWALINGPFKKKDGETAVLGRRDHKASIQMIYGPIHRENFRSIVEGYAKSLKAKPRYAQNQAWFDTTRQGHKLRFLFRHDNSGEKLVIFILNGNPKEMTFLYTNLRSPYPGLVPQNPGGK